MTIGNSVNIIGNEAFYNCVLLVSVNIPNSVTGIGELAFYDCHRLMSVTIPESVNWIGEFAFKCSNIFNKENKIQLIFKGYDI